MQIGGSGSKDPGRGQTHTHMHTQIGTNLDDNCFKWEGACGHM